MRPFLALAIALTLTAGVAHGQDRPSATAATTGGDIRTGENLFLNTCGFCHQDGGRVAGRGPKLAGIDKPDEYLLSRIRAGKEGAMPAYGRAFSDAQLRSLIAYIRSLKDDAK